MDRSLTQLADSAPSHDAIEGAASRRLPAYPGPKVSELEAISYGVRDGVAAVTLNRVDQRNGLDLRTGEGTLTVARAIAADPAVRSVLIAANGPAFSVGGDIGSFASAEPGGLGDLAARMATPFHEALRILSRIDPPIVTAVHGPAVGGALGYVYAADIVLAADDAVFSTGYSGIGLSGDGGGTWHLPRLVGAARARRMYLENLRVDAAQALDWGIVTEVVPPAELRERALGLARRLAKGPTQAFGYQRRLLRETWDHTLSDQLQLEIEGIAATGGSRDAAAAISAFVGKRRPVFEGR